MKYSCLTDGPIQSINVASNRLERKRLLFYNNFLLRSPLSFYRTEALFCSNVNSSLCLSFFIFKQCSQHKSKDSFRFFLVLCLIISNLMLLTGSLLKAISLSP